MPTADVKRSVTPEALLRMAEDGVSEAAAGRLIEKLPSGDENWTVGRVGYHVSGLPHGQRWGDVLAWQSFQCFADPRTVRRPDVAFLAAGRLPYPAPPGHLPMRPDLAVEVFSTLDDAGELDLRLADYRSAAVPLVWVVIPSSRTVRVVSLDGPERILRAGDTLTGGDVLPGFGVAVADLFRPVAPAAA